MSYFDQKYRSNYNFSEDDQQPEDTMQKSYLGSKNLASDVGTPDTSSPAASGAGGAATAGAASGGNPYMMAGSFLVNYLQARSAAFQKKKEQEIALAKGYQDDQSDALQKLNSNWKSALL